MDPHISYTLRFAEFEACVAAGLDLEKWEYDEYSNQFKAEVIAWHELSSQIKAHTESAVAEASKREARRR